MNHDTIHQIMRWIHIIAGSVGLVVFWIPVFAKKGSRPHIYAGRVFVVCGTIVGVTAVIASIWALIAPASFINEPTAGPEPLAFIRFFLGILGWLGLNVLASLWYGIDVIRTRKDPDRFGRRLNHVINAITIIATAGLLVLVVAQTMQLGWRTRNLIPIALAAFGFADIWRFTGILRNPRPTPMSWWYQHMEFMLGCGIGFHTAFAVFGLSRLLGDGFSGMMAFAWLLPAAIGMPATSIWIKYYKRKFGELDETPKPETPEVDSAAMAG